DMLRGNLVHTGAGRKSGDGTGRWGIDPTVTTGPSRESDLLDAAGIDRELETLADEDRGWRLFLARNGLSPMSVSYEQLCKDPNGFIAGIAQRFGIDPKSLRQGYTEQSVPAGDAGPSLPTKDEVISRYLA